MVALTTTKIDCDFQAIDFNLQGQDLGYYSLSDLKGKNGTVVAFICNHCPFVQAILTKMIDQAKELEEFGVNFIAISSNDTKLFPQDSFENMCKLAEERKFGFRYLFDETQEIAKAYGAVCTPDFFGFDGNLKLRYRGRFDDSSMRYDKASTRDLFNAMKDIAQNQLTNLATQHPSVGCSIKWKN